MDARSQDVRRFSHKLSADEIRRLVETPIPVILEIGCHDGTDTAEFLRAMPNAFVHCFEPDRRAAQRFRERFANDSRVAFYEQAIADVDGELPFHPSTGQASNCADWDLSGSLCKPTGHLTYSPTIQFKAPVSVSTIRLDTWAAAHLLDEESIAFAWVDIQGAQRRFLKGAQLALLRIRYLYIETHNIPGCQMYEDEPSQQEMMELLPDFEPLGIYERDNLLFKNRHVHQC